MQYLGYVAGALTTGSGLPQVIKTFRTKEAGDVSFTMYVIYLSAAVLWVIYGIIKQDGAIIITNTLTGMINVSMIVMKIKYDNKNQSTKTAAA